MHPARFRYWSKALSNLAFFAFVFLLLLAPIAMGFANLPPHLRATSVAVAVTLLVLAAQITAMYRHWTELTDKKVHELSIDEQGRELTSVELAKLPRTIFKSVWFVGAVLFCLAAGLLSGSRVVRERFAGDTAAQFRQSESMMAGILTRVDLERERKSDGPVEKLLPSEVGYATRVFSKSVHYIDLYTLRHPDAFGMLDEEKTLVQDMCRDLVTTAMGVCVFHDEPGLCDEKINPNFSVNSFLETLNTTHCTQRDNGDDCCFYVNEYLDSKAEYAKRRAQLGVP